ncbi:hypothetical protein [Streptomyces sp. NPDC085665]|uniref:hypothetical protein n=1 Tax=Streptomyces sp. NPDC085665 TaxID=3365735 RepID=UPI0037D68F0A
MTLPDDLAVPLVRGLYWTNLPHLKALEAWTLRWGTGSAAVRAAPAAALEERARAAAQITTTRNLLRAALHRTVNRTPRT